MAAIGGGWTLNEHVSDPPHGRPESGGEQNCARERGGGAGRVVIVWAPE
jgi:hypothetical protein